MNERTPPPAVPSQCHFTNLPPQMLLLDRLEHALERADRDKLRLAQLWVKFRRTSSVRYAGRDTDAGNQPELARRLKGCMRRGDTLVQMGSDEFSIILEQITSTTEPAHMAGEMIRQFSQRICCDGEEVSLQVSIGISLFPEDGSTAQQLQQKAHCAMQSAARFPRSLYRYFDRRLHVQALARERVGRSLSCALARGQMVLHYQPWGDPLRGETAGVEALLRWRHPGRGLVLPADFIPFLEESGLIGPVGEWVLREACKQLALWRSGGNPGLCLAVNISSKQLEIPGFPSLVRDILTETGMEAAALSLEIDAAAAFDSQHSAALEQLISFGIAVSLDNFGAGRTAFDRLKTHPLRSLKIDRRFVVGIPHCQQDVAIASAIIALAKNLGIKVVAKGVETREQLAFLHSHRCKDVQGFIFASPMPAHECGRWLSNGAPYGFLQACL